MKRLASLLLAGALALAAAGCAGQNPAASPQSGSPDAVESGKPSAAYVEELKIEQKIFDMMKYGYSALAQYPKSEKFALATDIKKCMDIMLERCIEAKKKYYKKSTLQELDVENEKLKAYLRLSHERRRCRRNVSQRRSRCR